MAIWCCRRKSASDCRGKCESVSAAKSLSCRDNRCRPSRLVSRKIDSVWSGSYIMRRFVNRSAFCQRGFRHVVYLPAAVEIEAETRTRVSQTHEHKERAESARPSTGERSRAFNGLTGSGRRFAWRRTGSLVCRASPAPHSRGSISFSGLSDVSERRGRT